MILLVILFLIIGILLFTPIEFKINYQFAENSKYKITIIFLFGLIKKIIDSEEKSLGDNNPKKKEDRKKKNKEWLINGIDFVRYLIDKGSIEHISLKVNIGSVEPCILGVTVGLIWTIINIIFSYFFRYKSLEDIETIDIGVIPLFNRDVFEIYFNCIIRRNLVYIIIVYLKNLKKRKGGDSIARTSYRRFNANYNE